MFTDKEKAQCVFWFAETKSLVSVQRKLGNESRRKLPHVNNIRRWFEQRKETGRFLIIKPTRRTKFSNLFLE
jgi:hypothetical protein